MMYVCLLMLCRYIVKTEEFFGATKTRDIYAKAIEVLADKQAKDMCLRFAALERKLGEIDRARAILVHAAQFCDPRTEPEFWRVCVLTSVAVLVPMCTDAYVCVYFCTPRPAGLNLCWNYGCRNC